VVEGRFGLLASRTDAVVDVDAVAHGLGARWEMGRVAIKPYPACHFLHAATRACGRLAEEHRLAPEDVAHIDVRMSREGAPSRFAAAVAIATNDGREPRLEVPRTPGSPGNPWTTGRCVRSSGPTPRRRSVPRRSRSSRRRWRRSTRPPPSASA
jgi:hypothetical protein